MTIFDGLTLIGGLCLFLFGMDIMGKALERRAGNKLQGLLGKLTTNKIAGLLTGLGVTSVIQSSSATTVMVVGFVNSGMMTLRQAINVIMGANIGTTVTAWILSLSGIEGDSIFMQLLKPMSFTPILALIGIIMYMFSKNSKKNDTGMILLGFAVLMFGMDIMTGAVSGLADHEGFQSLFILFKNPILGVLVGAILTAIIQSSSASVGILQALSATGQVSFGAAVPIIMGQNIGTCITAILSSFGTNKNAKRAALVHLSFNVIGTLVWLSVFCIVKAAVAPAILDVAATQAGIAVAHSAFNIGCTALLLPMSSMLEKLAYILVPENDVPEEIVELDERLLETPTFALERCHALVLEMADYAVCALKNGLACLDGYTEALAEEVRELEDKTDHYEDVISTYLVKLSTHQITDEESTESAKLLKLMGDFERIGDHAVNLVESAEEMDAKGYHFSDKASQEMAKLVSAVNEILDLAMKAFVNNDMMAANTVEPLEEIVDAMKEQMRTNHILRLQKGECSIELGFVWSDLLTNLERVSDHCSNIAGCVIEADLQDLDIHRSLKAMKLDSRYYREAYNAYSEKYLKKNEITQG